MDNLEETEKFLENYNFPKLNHVEIESINRPITSIKIKRIIKFFPKTKTQGRMASQVNCTKSLKKS